MIQVLETHGHGCWNHYQVESWVQTHDWTAKGGDSVHRAECVMLPTKQYLYVTGYLSTIGISGRTLRSD